MIKGTGLLKKYLVENENRNRWVVKQLQDLPAGLKLLDAGAGTRRYREYCNHLDYTSQDFCQYEGGKGAGLQFDDWNTELIDIVSDITNIPIEDDTFDVVLCTEVLEHVKDPSRALKELTRVLKKGGTLILTAPFCSLTHMAPYHFCTGFNIYWYKEWLKDLGFTMLNYERNGNYYDYLIQELSRVSDVSLKYIHRDISVFKKGILYLMIRILSKLSKNGNDSNELLCFGYHVIAKKNE